MSKKVILKNLLISILFLVLIIVNTFILTNSLVEKILLDMIAGILFIIVSIYRLKGIKNCLRSIEFIYGFCFFIYSIVGCLVFVMDNYIPRFYYFRIDTVILTETLELYINALCFYVIFCFVFNRIKTINFDENLQKCGNNTNLSRGIIIFFDMMAFGVVLYNLSKILRYGVGFFDLSTSLKREILNNGISHYINLFMLVYSLFITLTLVTNKNYSKMKGFKFNAFIVILYWLICLTCERRFFVTFLVGFIFIMLYKIPKIKLKNIIIICSIVILLLFSAAFRDNISFSRHSLADVIYSSTTEFYCTFMISDAYVYDYHELKYGSTYIVDSLSKLIPKSLYENKPQDLSFQFKNEYNTNVGFAFNPIAESILNFGKTFASIMTASIMFAITVIARSFLKKNILYYIIILTFSLDFCRGAFSNVFFDTLFCFIVIFMMFKLVIKRRDLGGKNGYC